MKATVKAPEWTTCCAEAHADELAMLRDHLEHRDREVTRLRDEASRERTERSRWEKDVRAAATRSAWDHTLQSVQLYVLGDAKRELYAVAQAAKGVEEHVRPGAAHADWAHRLRWEGMDLYDQLGKLDDPAGANGGLIAEIRRLRGALYEQGRLLHERYAGPDTTERSGRCGCPGCEMTRAAELHEVAPDTCGQTNLAGHVCDRSPHTDWCCNFPAAKP